MREKRGALSRIVRRIAANSRAVQDELSHRISSHGLARAPPLLRADPSHCICRQTPITASDGVLTVGTNAWRKTVGGVTNLSKPCELFFAKAGCAPAGVRTPARKQMACEVASAKMGYLKPKWPR